MRKRNSKAVRKVQWLRAYVLRVKSGLASLCQHQPVRTAVLLRHLVLVAGCAVMRSRIGG
ncbi:MAG TPA: hypothetical protein VKX25_11600 [Bryobacteraceae bacterium]|nr:hypothetical protein [Bryobacteraceae bacterium]